MGIHNQQVTFTKDDVVLGKTLGSGGFAVVREGRVVTDKYDEIDFTLPMQKPTKYDVHLMKHSEKMDSSFLYSAVDRQIDEEEVGFAVKTIRSFDTNAVKEFKNEVEMLRQISYHKNIVRMYGVSEDFFEKPKSGFVVYERLTESMDKAMMRWKKEDRSPVSFARILGSKNKGKLQALRVKKGVVDIAGALRFLHKHGIIYRDLKPANVGFDDNGVARLFDFGLARKVDPDHKMTARVGSLRYQAPEVCAGESYGFAADIYSFGMLLWEVCALEMPYRSTRSIVALEKMVLNPSVTPPLRNIVSVEWRKLMQDCWDAPEKRPSVKHIERELKAEILRNIDDPANN